MWLGVDDQGRDLFVRIAYGARTSLTIAIIATGIEVVIGVVLGMLAGFLRGWVDTIVISDRSISSSRSRSFSSVSRSAWRNRSVFKAEAIPILLISLFGWPYIARIIRGQTLSLRETQFVEAAYSLGAPTRWIIFKEILPNLVAPIIVYSTLIIPVNILGRGQLVVPRRRRAGTDGSVGVDARRARPSTPRSARHGGSWPSPVIALFLTVLGFNLLRRWICAMRSTLAPRPRHPSNNDERK